MVFQNKKKKIKGFTKVLKKPYCLICLEERGIQKQFKFCRKCLHDTIDITNYKSF